MQNDILSVITFTTLVVAKDSLDVGVDAPDDESDERGSSVRMSSTVPTIGLMTFTSFSSANLTRALLVDSSIWEAKGKSWVPSLEM